MKKVFAKTILLVVLFLCCHVDALQAQCGSIDFSADIDSGCSPLIVRFKATGAPSGVSYTWDFGTGGISGKDTIYRVFTSGGKFTIKLTVSGGSISVPCVITKTNMIKVHASPTPTFTTDPGKTLCDANLPVTFTDNTPNIVTRLWTINGDTFSSKSQSYYFKTNGYKSVSLKVKDGSGCVGYFSDNKYIQAFDSIQFDFCANITFTDTGYIASFSPTIIANPGSRTITSYSWSFPGGKPSSYIGTSPPIVTYKNKAKTYDITLVLTTTDGCTYTLIHPSFIKNYILRPDSVCANVPFKLSPQGNSGSKSAGLLAPHLTVDLLKGIYYQDAGTYDISFLFYYNKVPACTSTFYWPGYIVVKGPSIDFKAVNAGLCSVYDTLVFKNLTNEYGINNIEYYYSFYDTADNFLKRYGPYDHNDAKIVYGQEGVYTIKMEAIAPNGCISSKKVLKYIIIRQPDFQVLADSVNACFGHKISLFVKSKVVSDIKASLYKVNWKVVNVDDTAQNYIATGVGMNFEPIKPGTYDVTAVVTIGKCTDSVVKKRFILVSGVVGHLRVDTSSGCPDPIFKAHFRLDTHGLYIYPPHPLSYFKYKWHINPRDSGVTIIDTFKDNTDIYFKNSNCYTLTLDIIDSAIHCTSQIEEKELVCVGVSTGTTVGQIACLGDTVHVFNFSEPGVEKYKWHISPEKSALIYPSDTVRNPVLIFYKDTCYNIDLTASKHIRGKWCSNTVTTSRCTHLPKADVFSKDSIVYCAPSVVHLKADSTDPKFYNSYTWDFGDGSTLTTSNPNPVHIYTQNNPKGYTITITATDTLGCSKTTVKKNYIKVLGPVPKFSVEANKGCDSVTLTFHNLSYNVQNSKLFFDDGSPADSHALVKHTYYVDGNIKDSIVYSPTMVATDATGCSSFFRYPITLYQSPHADFEASPNIGCLPFKANFINKAKYGLKWKWDFNNDGIVDDTTQNPSYTYTKPGNYTVKLVAKGITACDDSMVKTAYIKVLPTPQADFSMTEKKVCGSEVVAFKLKGSDFANYTMDYGDGTIDTNYIGPHPYYFDQSKTLTDSLVFYPTLTAYSLAGCSKTKTDTIVVYAGPKAKFISDIREGCPPLKVQFYDSSDYAKRWEWDFDNNGTVDDNRPSPDHTFNTGVYTVKQSIYSRVGCKDSLVLVHLIRVNASPKAAFEMSDTDMCLHHKAHFTDISSPAPNLRSWLWGFNDKNGNADSSHTQHPDYYFDRQGWHDIFLAVEDNKGCKDTLLRKKALYVEDTLPPLNTFIRHVSVDDSNKISIVWNISHLTDFQKYRLKRDGEGIIDSAYNSVDTSFDDKDINLNTSSTSYCYRLQTIDKCNNLSIDSAYHCSIVLHANAGNHENVTLKWSAYHGWLPKKYIILRQSKGSMVWRFISQVGNTVFNYNDTSLCAEEYCYKILAVNASSADTSASNTVCLSPPYTMHNAPAMRFATVNNNESILLSWDPDTFKRTFSTYHIDRFSSQEGWRISYALTPFNSFIDKAVAVNNGSYKYRLRTQDNCGYSSPYSDIASSIWLQSQVINDRVQLSWNKYAHWVYGVAEYNIQLKQADGSFKTLAKLNWKDSSYIDQNVHTEIDTAYCYRLIAVEDKPVSKPDSSISNITCAVLPARIYAPNVFTPNKDNLNDVWKISAVSINNRLAGPLADFRCQIFDRWGTMLWQTNDISKGWDGFYKGVLAPMDVYVYVIYAQSIEGKFIHLKGTILLLK